MASHGELQVRNRNGVGELLFSHPKANCLSKRLLGDLARAVEAFAADAAVKVLLLQSAGEGSFCAGAFFEEFKQLNSATAGEEFFLGFAQLILAIRNCPKFVVCRVQGKVVGGGLGLVAASDYSFALSSASGRLSEFELGIGPFTIGPAVERKIGVSAFSQMSVDCAWRDASWLQEKGLYARLSMTPSELDSNVAQILDTLSKASPAATAEMKKMFWAGTEGWESLLLERARISGKLIMAAKPSM